MKTFPHIIMQTFILTFLLGMATGEEKTTLAKFKQDLTTPKLQEGVAAPGKRVKQFHPPYAGTGIYHALYLPTDWQKDKKYPVIIEYSGNQWRGSKGSVEECDLGYGISAGKGVIWVCLPYVDLKTKKNAPKWWGDVKATVDYCKQTVKQVCQDFSGDPNKVFIAGFSRGSIACNYIGLHDDEIAKLWRGFICHSHYDGVKNWGYAGADKASAMTRLKRLGNRPQFISHEKSGDETKNHLKQTYPKGNFTFQSMSFREHTDTWVLRNVPERQILREWFGKLLAEDLK